MRGMLRRSVVCAARERRPRSVRLGEGRRVGGGEEGDCGRVFEVVRLSKKIFQTSSRASQFSFQVHWVWTFLFPPFTQLRYVKNMRTVGLKVLFMCLIPVGWGCSWRFVGKVQIDGTFCGSGCRGGLGGRLLR